MFWCFVFVFDVFNAFVGFSKVLAGLRGVRPALFQEVISFFSVGFSQHQNLRQQHQKLANFCLAFSPKYLPPKKHQPLISLMVFAVGCSFLFLVLGVNRKKKKTTPLDHGPRHLVEALDVFFKCLPHNWSRSLFECPGLWNAGGCVGSRRARS